VRDEIAQGSSAENLDDLIDERAGENLDLGLDVRHRAGMVRPMSSSASSLYANPLEESQKG
jgi:hypothetical protein